MYTINVLKKIILLYIICRCYLGASSARGYKKVQLESARRKCQKYVRPQPIGEGEDYRQTCAEIIEDCTDHGINGVWRITKEWKLWMHEKGNAIAYYSQCDENSLSSENHY